MFVFSLEKIFFVWQSLTRPLSTQDTRSLLRLRLETFFSYVRSFLRMFLTQSRAIDTNWLLITAHICSRDVPTDLFFRIRKTHHFLFGILSFFASCLIWAIGRSPFFSLHFRPMQLVPGHRCPGSLLCLQYKKWKRQPLLNTYRKSFRKIETELRIVVHGFCSLCMSFKLCNGNQGDHVISWCIAVLEHVHPSRICLCPPPLIEYSRRWWKSIGIEGSQSHRSSGFSGPGDEYVYSFIQRYIRTYVY